MNVQQHTTAAMGSVQTKRRGGRLWQLLRRPQVQRWIGLATTVPLVAMLGACGGDLAGAITPTPTTVAAAPAPSPAPLVPQPLSPAEIAARMRTSTVLIRAEFPATVFDDAGRGSGTGIVFSDDGYIITNAHVVQGASSVTIALANEQRERPARVVATSPCDDLAVLKVERSSGLEPASFGQSADLATGEEVVALGFPISSILGDDLTITRGIISQQHVQLGSYESLIQTDATINPGNSGGPLLNMFGEVIGINTLKINPDIASNVNFAISIDEAMTIVDDLREGENKDWHGMNLQSARLPDSEQSVLVVDGVQSGSPADTAGIQPGDIVLTLEGAEVAQRDDVCKVVRSHGVGDQLKLELARRANGKWSQFELMLTLGKGGVAAAPAPAPTAEPTSTPLASQIEVGPFNQETIQQARDAYDRLRPSAQELLFETFQSSTTKYRWSRESDDAHTPLLHDNLYELMLTQAMVLVKEYWQQDGADRLLGGNFIVELDVALAHSTTAAGIAFGGQGNGNGSAFIIYGDGTWQLITFQGDSAKNAYTTKQIPNDAIIGGGNVNQLRVLVQDDTTLLYVNHTLVGVVQGLPATAGAVGVAALATNEQLPLGVLTDNFRALQIQ